MSVDELKEKLNQLHEIEQRYQAEFKTICKEIDKLIPEEKIYVYRGNIHGYEGILDSFTDEQYRMLSKAVFSIYLNS